MTCPPLVNVQPFLRALRVREATIEPSVDVDRRATMHSAKLREPSLVFTARPHHYSNFAVLRLGAEQCNQTVKVVLKPPILL